MHTYLIFSSCLLQCLGQCPGEPVPFRLTGCACIFSILLTGITHGFLSMYPFYALSYLPSVHHTAFAFYYMFGWVILLSCLLPSSIM